MLANDCQPTFFGAGQPSTALIRPRSAAHSDFLSQIEKASLARSL